MSNQITITGGGTFTRQNISDINSNFSSLFTGQTNGNTIYCQPSATSGQPQDGSQSRPYTTLSAAYSAGRDGFNDVIMLVGNGQSSGTARVDSSFTWSKNALHLIGVCSPVLGSFTTASPGGLLLYNRSVLVGIGEYGDTNGLANSFIDGLTGVNSTSGIAVNPS